MRGWNDWGTSSIFPDMMVEGVEGRGGERGKEEWTDTTLGWRAFLSYPVGVVSGCGDWVHGRVRVRPGETSLADNMANCERSGKPWLTVR